MQTRKSQRKFSKIIKKQAPFLRPVFKRSHCEAFDLISSSSRKHGLFLFIPQFIGWKNPSFASHVFTYLRTVLSSTLAHTAEMLAAASSPQPHSSALAYKSHAAQSSQYPVCFSLYSINQTVQKSRSGTAWQYAIAEKSSLNNS